MVRWHASVNEIFLGFRRMADLTLAAPITLLFHSSSIERRASYLDLIMIVILHSPGTRDLAERIESELGAKFRDQVEVVLNDASSPFPWPREVNWDDFLLVIYESSTFPDAGNDFIAEYLGLRSRKVGLLPVAVDLSHRAPPRAAGEIKAFALDASDSSSHDRLLNRIGAMVGLRVQPRDNQIFISYRAADGTQIALQLEEYLKGFGYPVWRDEAKDLDGETKILPGNPVQTEINAALDKAAFVLLLDTPQAPTSPWITHEIDTANARLLPILPICFRSAADAKFGSRFRSLRDLGRLVPVELGFPHGDHPLADGDLRSIVASMEKYICELFRRKCRVPFLVEDTFVKRHYTWKLLEPRLLMAEAIREFSPRLRNRVLNHCSIFDEVHGPAMNAFSEFLAKTGRPNHALYIYDGELIPEPQLADILESLPAELNVVILHHQELAALIESNFTALK